jgi:hypothetical protein
MDQEPKIELLNSCLKGLLRDIVTVKMQGNWCQQRWTKGRLLTFDLYPGGRGGGMGCRDRYVTSWPQLAMNCFLPLLATDSHTLDTYIWGEGRGDSDIRSMSSIRPICKCRCPPLRGVRDLRLAMLLGVRHVK